MLDETLTSSCFFMTENADTVNYSNLSVTGILLVLEFL